MNGTDIEVSGHAGTFPITARFQSRAAVTGIAGPSGSGKTSLLKMIAGLIKPDAGHIRIGGQPLFDKDMNINLKPEERRIGMVFQDARLFPHMRVLANLTYGTKARGLPVNAKELDQITRLLGIEHLLKRYPGRLSGGERQRVSIGRVLMASPRIMILDEPLTSVDRERRDVVLPFVIDYCTAENIPVLLVSHDEADIARYCQKTIYMKEGWTISS